MKTLVLMLGGALVGIAIASYVVPPALSWYAEPAGLPRGATVQAIVNIPDVIHYATGKLITGQIIGACVGGAVGLALGVFVSVRRRSQEPRTR
jgi:hypothetical protein